MEIGEEVIRQIPLENEIVNNVIVNVRTVPLHEFDPNMGRVVPALEPATVEEPQLSNENETPNDKIEETETVIEEEVVEECGEDKEGTPTEVIIDVTNGETILTEEEPTNDQVETDLMYKTEEVVVTIIHETGGNEENEMLSHLEGENIELDEALRSSTDTCENNNGLSKQTKILNKEELLDILEGNDTNEGLNVSDQEFNEKAKKLQSSLALQQYLELKSGHKTRRNKHKAASQIKDSLPKKKPKKSVLSMKEEHSKKPNVVNDLVQDWNDDDAGVAEVECEFDDTNTENVNKTQDEVKEDDSSTLNESVQDEANKSSDSTHRRVGRVIKKKVIFDPDNPDTFTKGKKAKDGQIEKSQSPPKKVKTETMPKAKSPINKPLWKKPYMKSKNQNKQRLTEVDKLLMDEGAVNMIYQLTPEASKGKKNIRTKAELIKKINQSSTPEPKEKKFRERRRETSKSEEVEGKKLLSKQKASGSGKPNTTFDDFEAHSADDSIIYRRHSSSSYSSTCMSPRRLSDFDGTRISAVNSGNQTPLIKHDSNNVDKTGELFMSGEPDTVTAESIVKKTFLNLKKKLNSTLPQALNVNMKRKHESKGEKGMKMKKASKVIVEIDSDEFPKFETISLEVKDKMAEIFIAETESPDNFYNVQTLKELTQALNMINSFEHVSVTIITSNCGRLCPGLDLSQLKTDSPKVMKENALDIANNVRMMLESLEVHNKVLLGGADGACQGLAVAMLALCDVVVATEQSTFSWLSNDKPLVPGMAVLTSNVHAFPKATIREMVYLGRQLSCEEAARKGLVSRVVAWPHNLQQYLADLATHLSSDDNQTLLLNKRLLRMDRSIESTATFLRSLEAERDILVEHWCSAKGQELIAKLIEE